MILKNITKNIVLSRDLKEAKSIPDKLLGILKKNNPRSMLFETRFGIHTFFLKDAIDVIVLNSQNKVVKSKTVRPNNIFVYNPRFQKVLELPPKTIINSKTQLGDTLEFYLEKNIPIG